MKCTGIEKVPIYYFADGGEGIGEVRAYITVKKRQIDKIFFQSENLGLKKNTLQAIQKAFEDNDKVIWLQDDMEFSKDFLEFMEFALNEYEKDEEIMFVSGYAPATHHSLYLSSYFSEAVGMWKHKFNLQLEFGNDLKAYQKFAGDMAYNQLLSAKKGKDVISAYLNYSMFRNNAYCLHPNRNKLKHIITENTTNCNKKVVKILNQNLIEGFSKRIDSGIIPLPYQYSIFKKLTRWISNGMVI